MAVDYYGNAMASTKRYAKAMKPVLDNAYKGIRQDFANRGMLYGSAVYKPMTQAAESFNRDLMQNDRANRDYWEGVRQYNQSLAWDKLKNLRDINTRRWELANAAALQLGAIQPKLIDRGKLKMPGVPSLWSKMWRGDPPEQREGPQGDGVTPLVEGAKPDREGYVKYRFKPYQLERDEAEDAQAAAEIALRRQQIASAQSAAAAAESLERDKFAWQKAMAEREFDQKYGGKGGLSDEAWAQMATDATAGIGLDSDPETPGHQSAMFPSQLLGNWQVSFGADIEQMAKAGDPRALALYKQLYAKTWRQRLGLGDGGGQPQPIGFNLGDYAVGGRYGPAESSGPPSPWVERIMSWLSPNPTDMPERSTPLDIGVKAATLGSRYATNPVGTSLMGGLSALAHKTGWDWRSVWGSLNKPL